MNLIEIKTPTRHIRLYRSPVAGHVWHLLAFAKAMPSANLRLLAAHAALRVLAHAADAAEVVQ